MLVQPSIYGLESKYFFTSPQHATVFGMLMTMEPGFVGSGAHVISVLAPLGIPFSVESVVDLSSLGYGQVNIVVIPNAALSQLSPAVVIGFVPRPGG